MVEIRHNGIRRSLKYVGLRKIWKILKLSILEVFKYCINDFIDTIEQNELISKSNLL